MKKIIKTFLKIIFAVLIICIVIGVIDFFMSDDTFHTVVTEIHKGCYIECLDDYMQSIYYYPDGDETRERKYIVEEWEAVKKYATDGKEVVAFHCVYNMSDEDEKNKLVICNTTIGEKVVFVTEEALTEFCKKEKIILSEWKKPHCE
ncbi:MAG: hypothetical protein IKL16_00350 [Clostridia bacterium]|nr:hypothetical protein [Clostridia bacterium]